MCALSMERIVLCAFTENVDRNAFKKNERKRAMEIFKGIKSILNFCFQLFCLLFVRFAP